MSSGVVSQRFQTVFHLESHCKILNLVITELLYHMHVLLI